MLLLLGITTLLQLPAFAQAENINIGGGTFVESPVPLETIVSRYIAWRGGAAYERLRSFHIKSISDGRGAHVDAEIWLDNSGRWRQDIVDSQGLTQRFVSTPDTSWVSDINGQIENDPSRSVFANRLAQIVFGDALHGRGGAKVSLLGISKGQSMGAKLGHYNAPADWAWIRVSFGDADTYDVLIDPVSGALSGYFMVVGGQTYYSLFGDWRFVDGVRMPFWWQAMSPTDGFLNLAVSDVELNQSFPSSLFARPDRSHRASFANQERSTGWINFDLVDGRQIRFPITVNGHEIHALLDNGATSSTIDAGIADQFGLAPMPGKTDVEGSGWSAGKGGRATGANIQIGSLALHDLVVNSIDLSWFGNITGKPVLFVLGEDVFSELVVDIDFPTHRLAFSDPSRFSPPSGATALPLVKDGNNRITNLSIEDRPAVRVVLDLGFAGSMNILPAYARSAKLADGRPWAPLLSLGVDGLPEEQAVIGINKISLGETSLVNVPAYLPKRIRPGRYPSDIQGFLGMEVLSRYRVIFDYSRDRLYLIPNRAAMEEPFARDHVGAILWPDGAEGMLVKLISPMGPAAKSGLKLGDRVDLINGKPADRKSYDDAWGNPIGTKIELTLAGGEIRTITLEEYY